ncbi:hypothetical protein GCM10009624_06420 [Gordonia sinesedis]
MRLAYLIGYLAIELAVFVTLAMTLGVGWAVLISLAASVAGFVMLRWQGRKVFAELRQASRNQVDPRAPLADTALLAAATVLLIVPGIVSTVIGAVLLAPPTRRAVRPAVVAAGSRRMLRAITTAGIDPMRVYRPGTVVNGTVVNGTVVDGGGTESGGTVVDGSVVDSPGPHGGSAGNRQLPAR